MYFQELLSNTSVCIDSTAHSKTAVLLKASQVLSQNHPELDADDIFDAFWKREALGSTAIGHGVVMPHIRSEQVSKTCACFLRLEHPVDFAALDKKPIDLVLAFVVPQESAEHHLQMLNQVIKEFTVATFRKALRLAKDNHALYEILAHTTPLQATRDEVYA